MTRGGSITLIGLFALVLGLPTAAALVGVKGGGAALQNRTLKARPPLTVPAIMTGTWGKDMTDWVWDVLPLRDQLLRLDHRIDAGVFRDSPVPDKVAFGARGFAFRIERVAGRKAGAVDVKRLTGTVKHLDDEATRQGRRLIIAVSPTKASLYPEYLPASYRRAYAQSSAPSEVAMLSMQPPVLDLWTPLRAEKKRLIGLKKPLHRRLRYLYRPTDDHWSFETGQLQAKLIVTAIDPAAWNDDRIVMTPPYVMAESELSTIYLKTGMEEPYTSAAVNPDVTLDSTLTPIAGTHAVTRYENTTVGALAPAHKRVLVVRDSFLSGLPVTPGYAHDGGIEAIAASFDHTSFVHWDAVAAKDDKLLPFFADAEVIVIQVTQGNLVNLMVHEATLLKLFKGVPVAITKTPPKAPQPAP
jgi:hypothetical protein